MAIPPASFLEDVDQASSLSLGSCWIANLQKTQDWLNELLNKVHGTLLFLEFLLSLENWPQICALSTGTGLGFLVPRTVRGPG